MRASTKPAKTEGAAPVRALSDSTIRQVYTILRSGLDGAVRDGLLARNPAAAVKRPGIERIEARHLTADEVSRLLKAADGSRYYPVLVLIANTGLRKGEALGLSWDRVDLDGGVIKVTATLARVDGALMCSEPKTQRSRRTVPLTPAMVTMLRKHRAVQAAEQLRAVNQWQNSGLVFTNELGGPDGPAQYFAGDRDGCHQGGAFRCRCPHPPPLGWGGMAGVGRAHPPGGRSARPQQHQHHGRHLRPRQRRRSQGCSVGSRRAAKPLTSRLHVAIGLAENRISLLVNRFG